MHGGNTVVRAKWRRTSQVLGSLVLVSLWLTTACGAADGPASPVGDEGGPFTYSANDRQDKLVEGAKKEGALTWYASPWPADFQEALLSAFNKKYPFIKVKVFNGDQAAISTRVVQETAAGRPSADVVEMTQDGAQILRDQGLLAPFYSPLATKMSDTFKDPAEDKNQVWMASDRVSLISFAYNTDILDADKVPTTLDDLLAPELSGKLAITSSTTGVRWIGAVFDKLGEDKAKEFFNNLRGQHVRVEGISGAALMGLMARGEVVASPAVFKAHAQQETAKGAHVKWAPLDDLPVVVNSGEAFVSKEAANPNSAMLFVDFLLGPDGAKVFKQYNYDLPADVDALNLNLWVPDTSFDTSDDYNTAYKSWQVVLDSLRG
ncbi:MAG: extracellular solute-binding protein [Actinophytocola sp.]|uniref:ABC transporter substrate-binding protein n=1 Tax=Actinophytocola sp. TaxID=1872138 RepID=UPI00132068FA|nr:extracellular solute-binding protein [Actinophytocola sp.]MPZ82102.1 extracellular solute-binding protein [Actinophytocola sp.]